MSKDFTHLIVTAHTHSVKKVIHFTMLHFILSNKENSPTRGLSGCKVGFCNQTFLFLQGHPVKEPILFCHNGGENTLYCCVKVTVYLASIEIGKTLPQRK